MKRDGSRQPCCISLTSKPEAGRGDDGIGKQVVFDFSIKPMLEFEAFRHAFLYKLGAFDGFCGVVVQAVVLRIAICRHAERGQGRPGIVDIGFQLFAISVRRIINSQFESSREKQGAPACANDAGSKDSDGFDFAHVVTH